MKFMLTWLQQKKNQRPRGESLAHLRTRMLLNMLEYSQFDPSTHSEPCGRVSRRVKLGRALYTLLSYVELWRAFEGPSAWAFYENVPDTVCSLKQ